MEVSKPCDVDKLEEAVRNDDADGLGRLLGEVSVTAEECGRLAAMAAGLGNLGCLKVLRARAFPDSRSWEAAAAKGHLHILHYLKKEGGNAEPECGDASLRAAVGGHLECLKFLHSTQARWPVFTAESAAVTGQLDCLAYVAEHGCRIGPRTCAVAALMGQHKCLRYLHGVQGCLWDEETTENAVFGANLSCLRYAVEEGCEVGDRTFARAVEGGEVECLKYLLSAGHRPAHPLRFRKLESDGVLDCLKLLASCGVRVKSGTVVLAASLGNLALVRQLHSFGDPLWQRASDQFDIQPIIPGSFRYLWANFVGRADAIWDEGLLHVPPSDEHLPACWGTLRYGSLHGAPLTPRAEALVRERRACAQEVLRCFHAAGWRAQAGGPDGSQWAAMSRLPRDVLMTIMELAEVEIYEALR